MKFSSVLLVALVLSSCGTGGSPAVDKNIDVLDRCLEALRRAYPDATIVSASALTLGGVRTTCNTYLGEELVSVDLEAG